MSTTCSVSSPAAKALSLAEALDVPHPELVEFSTTNPLLRRLATAEGVDEAVWGGFVAWMQGGSSAEDRLRELKREYYALFLRGRAGPSVYLHDWYPDLSPHEFLSGWRQFLDSVQLATTKGWRNGQDHVCLCLETFAHLTMARHGELGRFKKLYLTAWFPEFADQLGSAAASPFYRAAANLAGGLARDLVASA